MTSWPSARDGPSPPGSCHALSWSPPSSVDRLGHALVLTVALALAAPPVSLAALLGRCLASSSSPRAIRIWSTSYCLAASLALAFLHRKAARAAFPCLARAISSATHSSTGAVLWSVMSASDEDSSSSHLVDSSAARLVAISTWSFNLRLAFASRSQGVKRGSRLVCCG